MRTAIAKNLDHCDGNGNQSNGRLMFVDESGLNAGHYLAQRGSVEVVLDNLTINAVSGRGHNRLALIDHTSCRGFGIASAVVGLLISYLSTCGWQVKSFKLLLTAAIL